MSKYYLISNFSTNKDSQQIISKEDYQELPENKRSPIIGIGTKSELEKLKTKNTKKEKNKDE